MEPGAPACGRATAPVRPGYAGSVPPGDGGFPLSDHHASLLAPDYLDGLGSRSMDDLRTMRADCVAAETGLSYLRRMVQGPLDIVSHELSRRAEGNGSAGLADLVADLPARSASSPARWRGPAPQTLEPTDVDPVLQARLDALVGNGRLGQVPDLSDDDLVALAAELRTFEAVVSERRKAFFGAVDALQAELARRYRDGEASVESLLNG